MEAGYCLFCNKNEDRSQLIHLKTKVIQYETDLATIACEVLSIPVGSVLFICLLN